ncbi:MAG: hypothetical protein SP1CHLAM54_10410 [Chlamydiia bacterium]|nr:hypothetical protein [Chlamydiia bacterium]MCH9615946.1 hypothetical protein [Chlamydiia bacterium]MCH9628651.1 hypothetical protein [Chlamydiia bacterium]
MSADTSKIELSYPRVQARTMTWELSEPHITVGVLDSIKTCPDDRPGRVLWCNRFQTDYPRRNGRNYPSIVGKMSTIVRSLALAYNHPDDFCLQLLQEISSAKLYSDRTKTRAAVFYLSALKDEALAGKVPEALKTKLLATVVLTGHPSDTPPLEKKRKPRTQTVEPAAAPDVPRPATREPVRETRSKKQRVAVPSPSASDEDLDIPEFDPRKDGGGIGAFPRWYR